MRMTPRRWFLAACAATIAAMLTLAVLLERRARVDPLPPAVRTAVTNEHAARAHVDSQLVAASAEAEAAQRRQEIATTRAQQLERIARHASERADSLAWEAQRARSARDSALFWHLAYSARTSERDTLLVASATKDTAIAAANDRIAALTRAVGIADTARQRADSVLDAVVQSVTVCTVPGTFGRIRCPSRRTALIVGIAAGAAIPSVVRAVKDGRIRMPVPFMR